MKAVGYVRVSTREQADSRLGLDAQRRALQQEADRRGWELTLIEDAGFSGRRADRPGLKEALRLLRSKQADVLLVYKLDRVSRSVQDFAGLLHTATRQDWALVALDMQVDMTTPNGRLIAHILVAVAQWEAEMIGARTADAMAEAKERGERFGREPQPLHPKTVAAIVDGRKLGKSYATIAAELTAAGVPAPAGGPTWYASTVAGVYRREANAA